MASYGTIIVFTSCRFHKSNFKFKRSNIKSSRFDIKRFAFFLSPFLWFTWDFPQKPFDSDMFFCGVFVFCFAFYLKENCGATFKAIRIYRIALLFPFACWIQKRKCTREKVFMYLMALKYVLTWTSWKSIANERIEIFYFKPEWCLDFWMNLKLKSRNFRGWIVIIKVLHIFNRNLFPEMQSII